MRALAAFGFVLVFGTAGFMIIEDGWGFWRSLFFTVITISTVGYGDEGISQAGERFAAVLILVGIGTCTFALSQLVQVAVRSQMAWRRRMQKQIDRLEDHYIVCGLGRVGTAVLQRVSEASLPVVIVEVDPSRAAWARTQGHATVEGTATEDEILLKAGVTRARGIVCAAASDSENLVATLSARELNPRLMIISRVDDPRAAHKFRRAGATRVLSPAATGGADMADMLIRPHLAEFLERAGHHDGGYQLTEITIEAASPLVGQTIATYGARENTLVFVAIRHPGGSTEIRPRATEAFRVGDVVIIVGDLESVARVTQLASGKAARAAG